MLIGLLHSSYRVTHLAYKKQVLPLCAELQRPATFRLGLFNHSTIRFRANHSTKANHYAIMASEQHEWTASRVRETFLDYFKKNGHTFGEI